MQPEDFGADETLDISVAYEAIMSFLDDYQETNSDQIIVAELGMFIYMICTRIRQALLFEESAMFVGKMLMMANEAVLVAKENGNNTLMIAEEWRGKEDGNEMRLEALKGWDGDTIPEEWL